MINREDFNRALRLSVAVLVISLLILGVLWFNFLYRRFNIETENYRTEVERTIEQDLNDKVRVLVRQSDRLFEDELVEIKDRMINRMAVIKSNLFEYQDLNHDLFASRLTSEGNRYFESTGIGQSIQSDKFNLSIGDDPLAGDFATRTFVEQGDWLIYSEYSAISRSEIHLFIDLKDYLRTQIKEWIRDYRELDENILLFDQAGESLAESQVMTDAFREAYYSAVATSDKTGYTLGYLVPRSELMDRLDERRDEFQRYIDNHAVELAVFLSLFAITLAFFFQLTAEQLKRQIGHLNDQIIQHYRHPESTENELYREYGLSRAIDTLVSDAAKQQERIQQLEQEHDQELKRSRIELLQLQRRYEYMVDQTKDALVTQFTPLRDQIMIRDLIEQAHSDFDSSKRLRLIGDDETIISDRIFLQTLIETVFRLSQDDSRWYTIEYLVEKGSLKLFLTLHNVTVLDSEGIDRIKYLAEMLGGSVLRIFQDAGKFNLVLRLLSE